MSRSWRFKAALLPFFRTEMNRVSARNCAASLQPLNDFWRGRPRGPDPCRCWHAEPADPAAVDDEGSPGQEREPKRSGRETRPGRFPGPRIHLLGKALVCEGTGEALGLLYRADGLLKTGSPGKLVLESLLFDLCARRELR